MRLCYLCSNLHHLRWHQEINLQVFAFNTSNAFLQKRGTLTHSKSFQTSKTGCSVKIINIRKPLTIFAKQSILDVWKGSRYASGWWWISQKWIKNTIDNTPVSIYQIRVNTEVISMKYSVKEFPWIYWINLYQWWKLP